MVIIITSCNYLEDVIIFSFTFVYTSHGDETIFLVAIETIASFSKFF